MKENGDDTSLPSVLVKAFPNLIKEISKFKKAIKDAGGGIKNFKAGLSALSTTAKATMGSLVAIAAVVGVIKAIDTIIDKTHKSTEELIEEKNEISQALSSLSSDIESVNNQIAELKEQELKITDPEDKENLEKQIELLEQRAGLLEKQEKTEKIKNIQNAKDILESTKKNEKFGGTVYNDFSAGKASKLSAIWAGGLGAENYIGSIEEHISNGFSVTDKQLKSLQEIQATYEEITNDESLVGTDEWEEASSQLERVLNLLEKIQFFKDTSDLSSDYFGFDEEKIIKHNKWENYDYTMHKNRLLETGYEKGFLSKEDVEEGFGDALPDFEKDLKKQNLTLDDYVDILNNAIIANADFSNSLETATEATDDLSKSVATLSESMEKLDTVAKGIKTLDTAFAEMQEDGKVSFDTLSSIQEAFSDVEGIDNYIKKLADADTTTAEFNQILSDLTYAKIQHSLSDEEIVASGEDVIKSMLESNGVTNAAAVASDILTRAKQNLALQDMDITSISRQSLEKEAVACQFTKTQVDLLVTVLILHIFAAIDKF